MIPSRSVLMIASSAESAIGESQAASSNRRVAPGLRPHAGNTIPLPHGLHRGYRPPPGRLDRPHPYGWARSTPIECHFSAGGAPSPAPPHFRAYFQRPRRTCRRGLLRGAARARRRLLDERDERAGPGQLLDRRNPPQQLRIDARGLAPGPEHPPAVLLERGRHAEDAAVVHISGNAPLDGLRDGGMPLVDPPDARQDRPPEVRGPPDVGIEPRVLPPPHILR